MKETWTIDDSVLLALEPLDCGASVGFVAAACDLSVAGALAALERLEARGLLVSGMVESSGGTSRCWRVSGEGKA